ncbi:MAG: polyamine aminopropyltransferase [Myxococcales bacterium]|nr:polyamine aminopropyltransferase [Myxococcales bacterium]MCB9701086.1 polyamine aminopropyltransferase [Myxococcales bacterium]
MSDDWYVEDYRGEFRVGLRVKEWLHRGESEYQKIDVFDSEVFGRVLALDGVLNASERAEFFYHEMLVHPAMVTAAAARRVLIIGGGDGGTAREVLRHPTVEEVVMVEIDGAVVDACRRHLGAIGSAWEDPRLELIIGDGAAYVAREELAPFDVILLDGTDPEGPGEVLYENYFYSQCRARLAPGGVFAIQSASPFLMREVFLRAQRRLRAVFADVRPYFGPAPLYCSGLWSWTHCSAGVDPLAADPARIEAIEPGCDYYNREIHRAAFAVPNFLRRELAGLG